ncbi:MAG: endo alpha-1,4 polygalactosaminidase [Planctomycetota bacterium]
MRKTIMIRRKPNHHWCGFFGAAVLLVWALGCAPRGGHGPNGPDNENQNSPEIQNDNSGGTGNDIPPIRNLRLAAVDDYAYVLQGDPELELDPIAQSAFDLVIIDYSADGGPEGELSREDVERLKDGGDRIVLAYMSIGEAEVGRFYFDNAWVRPDPEQNPDGPFQLTDEAPSFLAPPNPNFPDNFKVRYWDPIWQEIILSNPGGNPYIHDEPSYLDRIVDAGFDGVYLDIIDAYEYFGPGEINADGPEERRDAAALMIELVIAIREHAEEHGSREFLVFPQNGSGIIAEEAFPADVVPEGETPASYAAQVEVSYFAAIDGIGAEDTFYFGDADEDNPYDPQTETIDLLDRYRAAGLLVLAIDYLTEPATIDDFYARARQPGWVPFCSTRDLAQLTINPTQPPD